MPKRILILDDDPDFTSLLTDIYRQSNYETVPFTEPKVALARLQSEPFDMLVTDHRMPGMTGEVLVRELRKTHPGLPVVVVSGFLDNDTIRDLIRDGVGGIFLKPLNVANLLKRTATLLNVADVAGNRLVPHGDEDKGHKLPFAFDSFPCVTPRTVEFANQLFAKRTFKGNLSLVTPPGTQTTTIIADLARFEMPEPTEYRIISPENITHEAILAEIGACGAAGNLATLVFRNPDQMSAEKRRIIMELGARKIPFTDLPPVRLLFTFTHPVDELFEKARIEEGLYMLASMTEVRVPSLAECAEEIPLIADEILVRHCDTAGIRPRLRIHKLAQIWMRERPWPGNYEELFVHIIRAAENAQSGLITRESFARECNAHQWAESTTGITSLETYLGRLRDDYVQAAFILCDGDVALTAEALGVPKSMLTTHPLAKATEPHAH